MEVWSVAFEPPRTYLDESNTRPVVRVHIGVYLEDKAAKTLICRYYRAFDGNRRQRTGGYLHETVEQFADTEVVQCRAEKDGCNLGIEIPAAVRNTPSCSFSVKATALSACLSGHG